MTSSGGISLAGAKLVPANPPPPPIEERLATGGDVDELSISREIIKARARSSIWFTMTSSALFSMGGSVSKKKPAATPYLRFLNKLYAFFSAAFLPRGEEKSYWVRNLENIFPVSV